MKPHINSSWFKAGYIGYFKGKHFSIEHRKHISESKKGKCLYNQTEEARKKNSIAHRGKNNWNWQGGKAFEPYSIDWTEILKRSIRERDHYICQLCNQYGNVVHHKDGNKKNCTQENLIVLCRRCHIRLHRTLLYQIKASNL
jgi:hypothetical protein